MVDIKGAPPGPDRAQEAWERSAPFPEPDAVHRLVYDYLVYNCFSETAKAFGDFQHHVDRSNSSSGRNTGGSSAASSVRGRGARKDKSHQPPRNFSTGSDRNGGATAMDIDDGAGLGGGGMDSEGDSNMYDGDSLLDNRPYSESGGSVGIGGMGGTVGAGGGSGGVSWGTAQALRTLDQRKHLQELITAGDLQEAIDYCTAAFPEAMKPTTEANVEMLFQLKCQQFIECVRKSATEALQYAHLELHRPEYRVEPFKTRWNDIMALIAYANPETSPVGQYLSQDRREEVASNLNSHILSLSGLPSRPAIDVLVRQAVVVRELLSTEKDRKNKTYPKWSLPMFLGVPE
ncbi:Ran-binding protein 9 [Rhizophlyctis rosea]|nr:Ran-binding protein 9 [Rhizophlyctis rosea]